MNPAGIQVLVITHRGGPLLERCVAALRPQMEPRDQLLVVVSALPGQADLEGTRRLGAPLLELGWNPRFARAANAGIARAEGRDVLLLNDDTEAQPGFVQALRAAAAEAGLYQPRILLSDGSGRLDNAGHGLFPDGFNWARGREDQDGSDYDRPGEVGACSGAAVLISARVLAAIGPLDGDLEAFGEDVDLSLRARRRGFPLVYVPQARIEHALGASHGRYGPRKVYLVERNRVRVAVRSLPLGAVLTMPVWTGARLAGLALAAGTGRSWGARVEPGAAKAAVLGMAAGVACLPEALEKRRRDAVEWRLGERDMWRHVLRNRVRLRDVLR